VIYRMIATAPNDSQKPGDSTAHGSGTSSRNAYKGGLRVQLSELSKLLRKQRNVIDKLAQVIWQVDHM